MQQSTSELSLDMVNSRRKLVEKYRSSCENNAKLEILVSEYEETIIKLEEKVRNSENEIECLKAKLTEEKNLTKKLEKEDTDNKSKLDECLEQKQQHESKLKKQESEKNIAISERDAKIAQLQRDFSNLNSIFNCSREERDNLEKNLADTQHDLQQKIEENSKLKKCADENEEKMEGMRIRVKEYQINTSKLQQNVHSKQLEIDAMEKYIEFERKRLLLGIEAKEAYEQLMDLRKGLKPDEDAFQESNETACSSTVTDHNGKQNVVEFLAGTEQSREENRSTLSFSPSSIAQLNELRQFSIVSKSQPAEQDGWGRGYDGRGRGYGERVSGYGGRGSGYGGRGRGYDGRGRGYDRQGRGYDEWGEGYDEWEDFVKNNETDFMFGLPSYSYENAHQPSRLGSPPQKRKRSNEDSHFTSIDPKHLRNDCVDDCDIDDSCQPAEDNTTNSAFCSFLSDQEESTTESIVVDEATTSQSLSPGNRRPVRKCQSKTHGVDESQPRRGYFCLCGKRSVNKRALRKHIYYFNQKSSFRTELGSQSRNSDRCTAAKNGAKSARPSATESKGRSKRKKKSTNFKFTTVPSSTGVLNDFNDWYEPDDESSATSTTDPPNKWKM